MKSPSERVKLKAVGRIRPGTAGNGLRLKHGSVVRRNRKGKAMAVKTRVTARKSEGVRCIEIGGGAGVVIDPATIERIGQSKHGNCKSIRPGSEEFERMVQSIPNADRLHDIRCPLRSRKKLREVM